ncbi:MAG: fimbrial assembly protein [Verrucomicrobia bacterium]|nr:MAG: fimbrial assembly protein [Verrucomicrobiota bacterium]
MSLPRVFAVDCGAGHLACGLLTSDKAGSLQLERFALDAFNPDASRDAEWAAMVSQGLQETVAREKFSGEATLGLPGHHILGKFIKIPSVEEVKRAKIVQFEAQQNIPYPLNEVVWDYQVVAEHGIDLELMLAAAKTEVVQGACDALSAAKLSVLSVIPSSLAVTRCFRYNYPEATGSLIIADIGARSTNLIFADSERFFVRTIPLAGNSITQAIAEELKHDFTHCETIKVQVLNGKSELPASSSARVAVQNAVNGFLSKLHLELTRSIVNYRRQSGAEQPATLYLTGGASVLADLPSQLEERLKISVQRLDPFRNVAVGPAASHAPESASMLASLIGLALPAEKGRKTINLLPPAIASRIAFKKRQPVLLAAAAIFAVALVLPIIQASRVLSAGQEQLGKLNAAIMPLKVDQGRVSQSLTAVTEARAEILAIQSLADSKNNWINFFSDLQSRLVSVEDVWLDRLQVIRATTAQNQAGGGGLFGGGEDAAAEPALDADGNPLKPVLRLQLSGRLIDRKNPISLVSQDSYQRVTNLLASFVDSQFISAVEKETFDATNPGILRFDFILVIDPARPL